MKILITGIAGLIGSNFANHMLRKGHQVFGVDNLFGGYKEFVPREAEFAQLCISRDANLLASKFRIFKPDVVYHFAAYAAEGLSPFIRNFNYTNNVIGSINVINNCINYDTKLVFTSSMAVYGENIPPFVEHYKPQPVDPYGIAKYTVEQDIKQAGDQFGLRYSIVRPHNVLGINQNIWDKYRNVIGIWIRRALNNLPILVYGDGSQRRAFSDIQFYLSPFEQLSTDHDGEIFNLGADEPHTLLEAAQIVQRVATKYGFNVPIEHVEARHEVKYAYCSHVKAKELLGFQDNTNLETLIETMFHWAASQPNREVKHMQYEITKNIYEYWK